jgi:TolB protein
MVETITPAVCGSRRRHRIALALFAVSALAGAAAVGLLLGFAGSVVGAGTALAVAAAVLAGLAALRELGLARIPLPQARRQVPERWHAELPLPLWSAGYGAGLGVGAFTFQPVATFWVACAAALALGRPLVAAALFSLYGLGRALMVALPRRRPSPTDAVERLVRRRGAVVRANGLALAACAVALALAPAAGAARVMPLNLGDGSELDPAVEPGLLAYTKREGGTMRVVVRAGGATVATYDGVQGPALDGPYLAFWDAEGVKVVRWETGEEVASVPGATRPALAWPWLAFRVDHGDGSSEIRARNLVGGKTVQVIHVGPLADIGRPAIGGGRIAWQSVTPKESRIALYTLRNGVRSRPVRTRIGLLSHPSLHGNRLVWVDRRSTGSVLKVRVLGTGRTAILARSGSRSTVLWTTSLLGRTAHVTRWFQGKGLARIDRVRF